MATKIKKNEFLTRGHEHYLSHILLLGKVSPVALKAIIKREEKRSGKDIAKLLNEKRDLLKSKFKAEYLQLFQGDKINEDIDSWDTRQLCAVLLAVFKSALATTEREAIKSIFSLRKDVEKYASSASLNFKTYTAKQSLLHSHLLNLIELIDEKAEHKCKQMMYSFEPKSMNVNEILICKLRLNTDVNCHLLIAMEDNVASYNVIDSNTEDQLLSTTGTQVFTETLRDKKVYAYDSAVLKCKLHHSVDRTVEWKKDWKPVEISDNLIYINNKCTHWLAIERATLEDSGRYSCVCGNFSTSADLTVIDEPLDVIVDLHVTSYVIENMNIDLVCKMNLLTCNPIWHQNGKVLQSLGKYIMISTGTTHKLTILNVNFQDEGEYTLTCGDVSSKVTVAIQGHQDPLLRKQLTDTLYRNWMRGALALKYLKIGLEGFSDKAVQKHHIDIMTSLSSTCNTCTEESLLPHKKDQCPYLKKQQCLCFKSQKQNQRHLCPNGGFCGKFYDRIVCEHRFQDPLLVNTDIRKWSSDPWSVATCFINTSGYKDKQSAKDVDCSGLLSMCINNIYIEMMLGDVIIDGKSDAFAQAREARNGIIHSPNYELSEYQLAKYLELFKEVLMIKDKYGNKPLQEEPGVEDAFQSIDMLQQNQIEIHFEAEIKTLGEHGLQELQGNFQRAKEQLELKDQLREKHSKDKRNEIELLFNLRCTEKQIKPKEPFIFHLHIQIIANNGEHCLAGILRVLNAIRCYIEHTNNGTSASFHEEPTDKSVYQLLDYINAIKECRISDAFVNQTLLDIRVCCLTSDAVANFLRCINDDNFQQLLFKLRRCLQVQDDIEVYDIIASCRSKDVETSKKRLYFTDVPGNLNCAKHQDRQCTLYCPDHDTFFCTACRESNHGSCHGLTRISDRPVYNEVQRRLVLKSEKEKYNVKIEKFSWWDMYNYDRKDCFTTSICILPNEELLLADAWNKKFKKLNSSYKIISYRDLPYDPISVCYIGHNTAVIGLTDNYVQYVDVSGDLKLIQLVNIDHECLSLTCHDDTIYINTANTLYAYNKNLRNKYALCHHNEGLEQHYKYPVAVSNDGERIYICTQTSINTVNNEGHRKGILKSDSLNIPNVCVDGEGSVLVHDGLSGSIYQVDYNGEKILGTVGNLSDQSAESFCFDKENCRMIVGFLGNNIYVYQCEYLPTWRRGVKKT